MATGPLSAGLLMFRQSVRLEVLLAHPGGPFFRNRDRGVWTIPKGEPLPGEALLDTGRREFREETGIEPPEACASLGQVRQRGGKVVHAWAFEGDAGEPAPCPPPENTFIMEWPPHSGRRQTFPEIDRLQWFDLQAARERINPAQVAFLERLSELWMSEHG